MRDILTDILSRSVLIQHHEKARGDAHLQKLWPHRWARPSGASSRSCCPPAWWQCCYPRDPAAPSASAPHSRKSDALRCHRPEELQLHPGSTCKWDPRKTHTENGYHTGSYSVKINGCKYLLWQWLKSDAVH